MPSTSATASRRDNSKRSTAERTKSNLFIGSFRMEKQPLLYEIALRCLLREDDGLLVGNQRKMAAPLVNYHPGALRGSVAVPGDKSISHRALIAGAAGSTPLRIANLNAGRDVRATREALTALGVRVQIGRAHV